jgi:bidirectional [NiFe] hydrogenase diaphorase subunit
MVHIQINGMMVQAEKGEMLLPVIRRAGIDIPALCNHAALEPCGACRLCMVEITKESWNGWKKKVTSCLYPVEENLIVTTHGPEILELRKTIFELYLARCPESEVIRTLAQKHGVYETSFDTIPDADNCIMCYACTRVCEALGASAISAVDRGHRKVIAPPFKDVAVDCVGCLACAKICPTDCITWEDNEVSRTIWGKQFDMLTCSECGRPVITKEFAEFLVARRDLTMEHFDRCDECKRRAIANKMGELVRMAGEVTSA